MPGDTTLYAHLTVVRVHGLGTWAAQFPTKNISPTMVWATRYYGVESQRVLCF